MSDSTHETVPTQFVESKGIRYAYRRFGKPGPVPLLFLEYFNSNMDGWDPGVTNSLAADHEVILFDNAGVGANAGQLAPRENGAEDEGLGRGCCRMIGGPRNEVRVAESFVLALCRMLAPVLRRSFTSIRHLSLPHSCSIQFSQRGPVAAGSLQKN